MRGQSGRVARELHDLSLTMTEVVSSLVALRVAPHDVTQDMQSSRGRVQGFLDECAHAGIEPALIVAGDYSAGSGADAMRAIIESGVKFDSVFAANDLMALSALQVLNNSPSHANRIAVIGFDNLDPARCDVAGLTTVLNPVTDMATASARMLLSIIDGETVSSPHIFTPRLIVRRTA